LWRVQYLDSQLKGDTQDLEEEELECSEPSWESPATVQQKKKKPSPPKKEKVTGVVAAGTKVRVTDPRFAGETGVVEGYRDGWHVVTLDADGSGA
jgi:transcription antitermination factor NusG